MIPYLTSIKVGLVLLLLVITSHFTHKYDIGQEALKLQKQKELLQEKNDRLEDEIQQLTLDYLNQSEKIHVVTKTIIKEIPKVITNETDNKYPISNGFVRMHDSAASGMLISKDSTRLDENPSEIKESEAAGVITENYESCNLTREKLISLQNIIKKMQEK